jgi:Molecular chaperone, HSP90 family
MSKFEMRLDLNVLNHLGLNLYSSVPPVLSEIVANSWDADAEKVEIEWIPDKHTIVIKDDGIGMTEEDINGKYLTVGYAKRNHGEVKTPSGRDVMGRKGIGKLSIFSIAEEIELYSVKDGVQSALRMDIQSIQKSISSQEPKYTPEEIPTDVSLIKGTKIILKKIKKRMAGLSHDSLRHRIARRFTVISPEEKFVVTVNGNEITIDDRDYFDKVQCCFCYSSDRYNICEHITSAAIKRQRTASFCQNRYCISGWLGTAAQTTQLNTSDGNINKIVVVVRGKVAQEDILYSFGIGSIFSKYVFGEIRADFLDDDSKSDITTSSRQQIIEDDERFVTFLEFIKKELSALQSEWETFRAEEGTKKALEYQSVNKWFQTLDRHSKTKAKMLFGKINKMQNTPEEHKTLLRHSILAFETLRYKDQLNLIDAIDDSNIEKMLTIFQGYDDIEASLYFQIAKGRVHIIKELSNKISNNELEKVIQKFIFEHLWLLDPMWERATSATPEMEKRVSSLFEDLDKKLTKKEKESRVDIQYKTSTNKHIIIELKRASVKTSTLDLMTQVDKYIVGLKKLLPQHGILNPEIETICIIGEDLTDWGIDGGRETSQKKCESMNMRVIQYQTLIENSYRAYQEYLEASKKISSIQMTLDQLDQELS